MTVSPIAILSAVHPDKMSERGGGEHKIAAEAPVHVEKLLLPQSNSNMDERRLQLAVKTINLQVGSDELAAQNKLQEIYDTFDAHYRLYESLFSVLTDEACYVRADRLRHPLIFYLGHTAAFYINKLILHKIIPADEKINPFIEELVAVGVDEMSWDDLLPDGYPWPTVKEMYAFRQKVHDLVTDVMKNRMTLKPNDVIGWDHPFWAIIMAIEHERIHLETSTVLIRQIPLSLLNPKANDDVWNVICSIWRSDISQVPKTSMVDIAGGDVYLGRSLDTKKFDEIDQKVGVSSVYGWDNEYGTHHALVPSFKIGNQLISNADWLEFIRDGGYEKKQYWSEEGWGWVTFIKPKHALFWVPKGDSFVLRTFISETETMPWDWPVEVNALESNAYCRWYSEKSSVYTRLPTEDEWNLAMNQNSPYVKDKDLEDSDEFLPQKVNIGLKFASSTPVDMHQTGKLFDVCGNVWQWTKTPTYPFDGFEVHPIYLDFTTPCFDDKHNTIKGGSWVTTGNEATRFSRYAFRRHFFQNAGFRIVQDGTTGNGFEPEYEPKNVV